MYASSSTKLTLAATTVLMAMLTAMPMAQAKCSPLLDPNYCRIKELLERRQAIPDYKLKLRTPTKLVVNDLRPAVQPNSGQIVTHRPSKLTIMP